MSLYINRIIHFFAENIPDSATLIIFGPIALLWAVLCLIFSGYLKVKWNFKTGYTRKVFHFLIFGTVIVIHWIWGTSIVCIFGGMTSLVITYAIFKGNGHIMYEAIAREKDAPERTYYIVVPYLATLIGGLLSNIFFSATASFGYLVTGFGDAAAEPVGTRFGRHLYKVPSINGIRAVRSLEGSFAVFISSLFVLILWFALSEELTISISSFLLIFLISFISTIVEAVSPHGWDNATLQIVPSLLGFLFLQSV